MNVGDYRCVTVEVATTKIDEDGFTLGTVTSSPVGIDPVPGTWYVIQQDPAPGKKIDPASAIDLVAQEIDPAPNCP